MKKKIILLVTLFSFIILTGCHKNEISPEKPGKPSDITVTIQEDQLSAKLTIAEMDNVSKYIWYKDGSEYEITEVPECIVNENGLYKVAGENEAGMGEFSEEVNVDFSAGDKDNNLLTEEYIPDEAFRSWINKNLAEGTGVYTIEQAATYNGEIYLNYKDSVASLHGIEYFKSLKKLKCEDVSTLADIEAVKELTTLEYLMISYSKCTEFDLTSLVGLKEAYIMSNPSCKADGLKVSGSKNLQVLCCNSNKLESLDLTGCTSLVELVCSFNNLTDDKLILPESAPLSTFAIHQNKSLSKLDLSKFASTLTMLNIGSTGFKELDLTGMSAMEDLDIQECGMTEIKGLQDCSNMKFLRIDYNNFEKLDVSSLKNLEMLRGDFNKLTSIDLSNNSNLLELSFEGNELSEIVLDNLSKCWYINISQNKFERVDLTPCTSIEQFYCNGNKLKELENKLVEIKVSKEYDVDRLNGNDFNSYCDELGIYLYSYDGTGIFVHEFSGEEPTDDKDSAKIGDFYYSDGTWSSTLDNNKTPIGIVFQTDMSRIGDAEKAALMGKGITEPHGLVLSLKEFEESYIAWTGGIWDEATQSFVTIDIESLDNYAKAAEAYNDISGLSNSEAVWALYDIDNIIYSNPYPVFSAAILFDQNQVKAPETSTGWFIPSFGQIWDIMSNLAGQKEALDKVLEAQAEDIFYGCSENKPAYRLNSWMESVSRNDCDLFNEKEFSLWTSSEYNTYNSWIWTVAGDGNYLSGTWYDKKVSNNKSVRFVLAF